MKPFYLIFGIVFMIACSVKEIEDKQVSTGNTQRYDSLLAVEMGADAYGMRKYVLAYLKAGPNRDQDSVETVRLQRAHLDNITRMAEEGKLVVAGPFLDEGEARGIYVFAVETLEEAQALTSSDPAIQAGRLVMELHPWYASAALMKINDLHNQISRESK